MIRLYNTAARAKQELVPINPDRVTMYVCGPTVYGRAHIGNFRPAVVFDVLQRLLRHTYGPEKVIYARNITDIDDKIMDKARAEGVSIDVITDRYETLYLEDAATEFQVQGLELDWACLVWDADFRYSREGWQHYSFVGERWQHIRKDERKSYLKNAYRVLLTRARQGMVIAIPEGDPEDDTRRAEFYDSTFEYLKGLGLQLI
jgi:hypothetical protein